MQASTLVCLAAFVAVALAEGQYYVPRAYYVIDSAGHASDPVPLRRLRRSPLPIPNYYPGPQPGAGASANANANAVAWGGGGGADANANANAFAGAGGGGGGGSGCCGGGGGGGWGVPSQGGVGAANPLGLSSGQVYHASGPVLGHSVTSSSSVGVDSTGRGYYDQYTAVGH